MAIRLGRKIAKLLKVFRNKNPNVVHFLHIGKTGGTAIRAALKDIENGGEYEIVLHNHGVSLSDIPRGQKVVFFLREPISRFVSGFYSRKRKGLPRYLYEWNDFEKETFSVFETPNQLAMALSDTTSKFYFVALDAMKNVKHLEHFNKWLLSKEDLESRREDIFYVGYQESLNEDFEELKNRLCLSQDISLPCDDIGAHRSPGKLDESLTTDAEERLLQWYADDVDIVMFCKNSF